MSSNSTYTVPASAKIIKIWSIGAGGSSTDLCDGGRPSDGRAGVVSYRHGFISNTNIVVSGVIGQPVASACDLYTQGGSSTLSNLSTVINPSVSSVVGGGGGNGFVGDRAYSGSFQVPPYTLWTNYSTRRDYLGVNAIINAAGGNASTHTYGRGSSGGNGSAGAVIIQFLPATDLVIPFTGSGSFTIPAGYSSVKIWAVGAGGVGYIYCDGGNSTTGGAGGIAYKTWSVSAGQTITYNAAPQVNGLGVWCSRPTNGSSSTATLNGTTITGGGGLSNGTNGSGTGGDGSGVAGNDVSSINAAYLSYSSTVNMVATIQRGYLYYGYIGDGDGNTGGVVLVKFMV